MFNSLFELPLVIVGIAIMGLLWLFALVGLALVRCYFLPCLRIQIEDSEFSGAMLQAVMVFYGLAVALIAVSVWQSYSDTSKLVSQEAATLAAIYREASFYPEPQRSALQRDIRDYTDFIIRQAWPLQQRRAPPPTPPDLVERLARDVMSFEPTSEGQKLLHGETLRALNEALKATRLRMDAAGTALPSILWMVVVVGAVISLSSSFFFKVEDARLHQIMVLLLATFIGLVIFMIFALDRPFAGDLGLRSDPYQIIYNQLMKP